MPEDKELIRRALLGDQQAQEELSNKFIPIPCAFCKSDGSNMKVQYDKGVAWMECQACGACGPIAESDDEYTGEKAAIRAHNTRPAPPIGKCKDCKFYTVLGHCKVHSQEPDQYGSGAYVEMLPDDFCSYFEPREE